ncbi:hypothetical protein ACFC1R_27005 [Kitasatospora sp. NPDC056138]|uniref:hypothetical protein n=1 Tax=Kitasatospora sp. NPDC056138 TaxID=3345724 RepID=UPI0035DEDF70
MAGAVREDPQESGQEVEAFELDLSPAEQSALAILWTLADPKPDEREALAALLVASKAFERERAELGSELLRSSFSCEQDAVR